MSSLAPIGSPEWIAAEREYRKAVDAVIAAAYEVGEKHGIAPAQLLGAAGKLIYLRLAWTQP